MILKYYREAKGLGKNSYPLRSLALAGVLVMVYFHFKENKIPLDALYVISATIFLLVPQIYLIYYVKNGCNKGIAIKQHTLDLFWGGWAVGMICLSIVPSFTFILCILINYISVRGFKKIYRFVLIPLGALIPLAYYNFDFNFKTSYALIYASLVYLGIYLAIVAYMLYLYAMQDKKYKDKLVKKNEEIKKQSESLDRAQSILQNSDRLAILGQITASIAHEINSPLGAIKGNVDYIISSIENELNELSAINEFISNSERMQMIQIVHRGLQNKNVISTREERELRRKLKIYFNDLSISHAHQLTEIFAELRIENELDQYSNLFFHPKSLRIFKAFRKMYKRYKGVYNIKQSLERANKIIYAIRSYSHSTIEENAQPVDVVENIELVLVIYQNEIKRGVELVKEYEEDIPLIKGYPDELGQVWTNLISNALYAMDYKGTLTIRINNMKIYGLDYVIITIIDTGKGIPDNIKTKIFDPFFTTKSRGVGSGLGLDITMKIVDKHKGEINFKSRPGNTEFKVYLPVNMDEI